MSKKRWFSQLLPLMAALLGLSSCTSVEQNAPVVETLGQSRNASSDQLSQGRQIYVTRCAKCHRVEPVRKYAQSEWEQEILPEMSKKAKLSAGDMATVRAYVMSALRAPAA